MILNRAYIKIDNKNHRNTISEMIRQSFNEVELEWNDNVGNIVALNTDSFQIVLFKLLISIIQDFNIKISIIIVPYFDNIFIKYLDMSYNRVSTIFEIFVRNIDNGIVKKDMKDIYNSFLRKDVDTIKAFLACNQNSKITASELFLHRNSFNYRLNQFSERTKIDIRDNNSLMFLNLIISYNL